MSIWMIVEDEPDIYALLMTMFDMWGIEGVAFVDGEEATEWIDDVDAGRFNDELPELALLDIKLPGTVNGLQIGQRLRQSPKLKNIAIVMMSAYTEIPERGVDFLEDENGPDKRLMKPLPKFNELQGILEDVVAKRRKVVIESNTPQETVTAETADGSEGVGELETPEETIETVDKQETQEPIPSGIDDDSVIFENADFLVDAATKPEAPLTPPEIASEPDQPTTEAEEPEATIEAETKDEITDEPPTEETEVVQASPSVIIAEPVNQTVQDDSDSADEVIISDIQPESSAIEAEKTSTEIDETPPEIPVETETVSESGVVSPSGDTLTDKPQPDIPVSEESTASPKSGETSDDNAEKLAQPKLDNGTSGEQK